MEIRRLVAGWTMAELRAHIELCMKEGGGLDPSTLGRWLARRSTPRALFRGAIEEVFEPAPIAALGLGLTFEAARNWTYMTPEERDYEMLKRRDILKGIGAAGLLLPVSDLVAAAQLLDGRPRIGAGQLAYAQDTATELASAYIATPTADVIRAAQAHAYTLLDLLKPGRVEMSSSTRARLQAVASDAAALAGYGHLNAGRLDQADPWFARALDLAREAGDRRLEALALASHAWTPLLGVDKAAGIAALEAAAEFHPFLRPAGNAYVFGYLAGERAARADDLTSGRFLWQALSAVKLIPHDEPGWGWWSINGELGGWEGARPLVFTGGRLLNLGRPGDALEFFDGALGGTTLPVRRSHLHMWVMEACVGQGDPDRACASAIAALDEGQANGVGVIVERVRNVRTTFPARWNPLTSVIELDERLAVAA
ncbi:MAG: hypothetical protein ACRDZO_19200 [Egibacteraceae bacterium]